MTLNQFISKWIGKKCCLGGLCQCVALARQYIQDVLKFPQFSTVNSAYQVFDIADTKYYTKIKNTPSGVPKTGDIIIWSKSYGGSGHIAIVKSADVNGILSFDQNYTGHGELPQLVSHNYSYVMGWLRPKGVSMGIMYRQKDKQTVWYYLFGSRIALTDPKQVEQLGGWSKVKMVSTLPNYRNKCEPITKEVPIEVIKEVIKEVLKEVIKEVPKEVCEGKDLTWSDYLAIAIRKLIGLK